MLTPNKASILREYEALLRGSGHTWTQDEAKLKSFLDAARRTLDGGNAIDRTGHLWLLALERHGLFSKKQQTLKALHALPDGER